MLFLVLWIVGVITTGAMAAKKKRNVAGWVLLSIAVAPLVSAILWALPPLKKCISCEEPIKAEARLCRYCGGEQAVLT